jgi:two-component system, cell cycle sensor histidine kinase and response regulator CckA
MDRTGDFSTTLEESRGVLLVDDDPNVLRSVCQMLSTLGRKPLYPAESVVEALDLWRLHRDGIEILITDFIMPNLTGDHLALRMLNDKRELKVLFISGNDPMSLDSAIALQAGHNFLQKPFRLAEIQTVLQSLSCAKGMTPPQPLS